MFNTRDIQIALVGRKNRQNSNNGKPPSSLNENNRKRIPPLPSEILPGERKDRLRDRAAESVVESTLINIQSRSTKEHPMGFPIYDVVNNLSVEKKDNNFQGGFGAPWRLLRGAETGDLIKPGTQDFQSFKSACAEAIVYDRFRKASSSGEAPITTMVFHDPIKIDPKTDKAGLISFVIPGDMSASEQDAISKKVVDSVGGFTPDVLIVSPPFTYPTAEGTNTHGALIADIVDPTDTTASRTKNHQRNIRKTLISPVEITVSDGLDKMQERVKKFVGYKKLFKDSPIVDFVPVLAVDRDSFMKEKPDRRARLVKRMTDIGGVVQLVGGLSLDAEKKVFDYSVDIIRAVKAYRKQNPKTKEIDSKQDIQKNSLSSRLLAKPKEWFKNIKQSFSSNKNTQVTDKVEKPAQKESPAESYQRMISNAKSNTSSFQRAGLDTNNSNHINLIIAATTAGKDLDTVEVLKQSPEYLSKRPAVAKMWLDKIVEDGDKIASEGHFGTAKSQRILQFYNEKKAETSQQKDVGQQKVSNQQKDLETQQNINGFDDAAALIKNHSSEFKKMGFNVLDNRKDLFAVISFAILSKGDDPSKSELLRQSPEFLAAATPEEGEALINESIESAKSTLESTKPEPLKTNQRGGFER
jgi:hypothetical protein